MAPQLEEPLARPDDLDVESILDMADDFLSAFSAPSSAIRSLAGEQATPAFPRLARESTPPASGANVSH